MSQIVTQAVVVPKASVDVSQLTEKIALFDNAGAPILIPSVAAATWVLTGYTIALAAAAISAADTLNVALGKLEKRIVVLETA